MHLPQPLIPAPHLHNVFLALLPVLASRPDCHLTAQLLEVRVCHRLSADEAALKVSMDTASGLRRFGATRDLPALDLVLTSGEEVDEVYRLQHR